MSDLDKGVSLCLSAPCHVAAGCALCVMRDESEITGLLRLMIYYMARNGASRAGTAGVGRG